MAVDEKYVEKVENKEEINMDEFLNKMGVDASYKAPTESNLETIGFDVLRAKDLPVKEVYMGNRVALSDIYLYEWEDKYTGEITREHHVDFIVFDDDGCEAYLKTINLKNSDEYIQKNVYGKLRDIVVEIMDLTAPGISKQYNSIDKVDIKALQKHMQKYESMSLMVVQKEFKDKEGVVKNYSDFKIVDGKLKK